MPLRSSVGGALIFDRGEYVSFLIYAVAWISFWFFLFVFSQLHIACMLLVVAVLTQQLQVIKSERDARIVNVSCIQMHFVVNDLAGLTAALTNAVLIFEIGKPAILPALGFVKLDCKRFHD